MPSLQAEIFCSAFHMAAYFPFLTSSSSWVPDSAIFPSATTKIWSAFLTMDRVWAIITTVFFSLSRLAMACFTASSFSMSRDAVRLLQAFFSHEQGAGVCNAS